MAIKWTDEYVLETYGLKVGEILGYQGQTLENVEANTIVLDTLFTAGSEKAPVNLNLALMPNCRKCWVERQSQWTAIKYLFGPVVDVKPAEPEKPAEDDKAKAKGKK